MSEALDAITDIQAELLEYGTNISIRTYTEGSYNSYTGSIETYTDVPTKAFIQSVSTGQVLNSLMQNLASTTIGDYDLTVKCCSSSVIDKSHKIIYNLEEYNIMYVNSKVLQDTTLIYEILIRK